MSTSKSLLALALGACLLSACAPKALTPLATTTNHWVIKGTMPDGSDILQQIVLENPTEPFSGIKTYKAGNITVQMSQYGPVTVQSTLPDNVAYGCLLAPKDRGYSYSGVMVRGAQSLQLEDRLRLSELQGGNRDLLTPAGIRAQFNRSPESQTLLGECSLTLQ